MAPTFSIIMATYNRGKHIVPTIRSVLQQTLTDFELLIIGDACDDDTEAVVRPFLSDRVKWRNLERRGRSQSFPNNAGIEMAQGRYIAYLGHDDVWHPDHLSALQQAFASRPEARFAVSGCLVYGPAGGGWHAVCGMFASDEIELDQFIPPSCFAHDRSVPEEIGLWRPPDEIKATVDADFLLRADSAGMRFVSSRQITTHKIGAAARYLVYMGQSSVEQEMILHMMQKPDFSDFVETVVARARQIGTYMNLRFPDFKNAPDGKLSRQILITRGVDRPQLIHVDKRVVLPQINEPRAFDWGRMMRTGKRIGRWTGINPRPNLMLPVAAESPVAIKFWVLDASEPEVVDRLVLRINGRRVRHRYLRRYPGRSKALVLCRANLKSDGHSVLQFDLTGGAGLEEIFRCVDGRPERIALGEVRVRRLDWSKRFLPL